MINRELLSMKIRQRFCVSLLGCVTILTLFLVACGANENGSEPSISISPKKGNPKLDSQLNQLILAQAKGEAASFAQNTNIGLTDGRVRVVIECVPGQLEAASKAAISSGAQLETTYENLIQVSIPVTSLTALTNTESIRLIRLPQQPVPASNK